MGKDIQGVIVKVGTMLTLGLSSAFIISFLHHNHLNH